MKNQKLNTPTDESVGWSHILTHRFIGGVFLLTVIFMTGCIDEITFDPSEIVQSQLVVDGQITTSEGPHILRLSHTQNDNLRKPAPVSDAQITIFDDLGNQEDYVQLGFTPGEYHLMNEIVKGEVGRTYFIEIYLKDGSVIRSKPERLNPVPKMTKLEVKFEQETEFDVQGLPKTSNFAKVLIDTPIPNSEVGVFLRWDAFADWLLVDLEDPWNPFDAPTACYFRDDLTIQNLTTFNSKKLNVSKLNDLEVGKRFVNHSFHFKQYFSVFQYSLTPRAYTFYEQLGEISSIEGNLFDEPPAAIQGNLFNVNDESEKILGYFSASATDTLRTFLVRGDVPFSFEQICPLKWPRFPQGDPCYACEAWEGSSTEKPDFFE